MDPLRAGTCQLEIPAKLDLTTVYQSNARGPSSISTADTRSFAISRSEVFAIQAAILLTNLVWKAARPLNCPREATTFRSTSASSDTQHTSRERFRGDLPASAAAKLKHVLRSPYSRIAGISHCIGAWPSARQHSGQA